MARSDMLERVRSEAEWDVVIIGGGATGLGAAVDAASRGYKTLLLEAYDFAKGTSSRSTKLVHGGVRYLAQGNVPLVRDALHERGLLQRNAPHIAHKLAFVIPLYAWWAGGWYGMGMRVYDLLAGKLGIGSSRIVGFGGAIQRVPTLQRKGLLGGVVYYDGQFDDARLSIALLRTFLDQGGVALNYLPVTGMVKNGDGRVAGVRARDAESGEEFEIAARAVVNATGVYADTLRRMDEPQAKPMLAPSQGIHFVLDRSFLPGDHAIMIPRTDDGRVLFVIPWHNRAVLGTTDTPVADAPIEPRPLEEEITFLLDHANRYLNKPVQRSDVLSTFAGLRPLVKAGNGSTAALSRDHTLVVSRGGLITITGGKWTTYRKMGEDTINKAITVAALPKRPCVTRTLKLRGWQEYRGDDDLALYGADRSALKQVLAEQPGWNELLHPRLPYRTGEVVWAARYEMARTVEDVLSRRTRALLLDARASQAVAPKVAALLAQELGFDDAWQAAQVAAYRSLADGYLLH
ncbi:MAG: FAD-dependent oxidoreductase [Chloroflexi bacterium]|nr:MAG: FAD-dependent oxidoreductase [Chloroflexota bacterium]